jgi:hypothetical protein
VARGGEDSRCSTGGGERGGATRGREAQSCRAAHMAGQGRRRAAEEKQSGDRDWGRRRGPGCKKQKVQGPHCNAHITFKPKLKLDGPKSKSAGFFKIYNFALGFICRRATVLKLIRNLAKFLNFM